MSSKHLIDLLILTSSAQVVLRQHFRLQARQVGLYTQTSSIIELLRGRVNRKAGPVGNSTEAPQNEVKVDIGRTVEADVQKPLDAREGTQGQVTAVIGEFEGDRNAEQKEAKHNKAAELEKRPNTTSSPVPERQPQLPPLSSPRGADPDLFILRSARGLSPMLSRIKGEENGKWGLQPGYPKERGDAQRPLTLHSDVSLSAIPTPLPLSESPPTIVPQETLVTVKKQAAPELKTQSIAEEAITIVNPPHPDGATKAITPIALLPTHSISSTTSRVNSEIYIPSPPLLSLPTSNNSPTLTTDQALTSGKTVKEQTVKEQSYHNMHLHDNGPATSPSGHTMTASSVPSSRLSRMFHYTGLAAGIALGAVNEGLKRAAFGSGSGTTTGEEASRNSLILNEANIERLVRKLSRMRGAALKLGQMLSFQDSKVLPPTLHLILSRLQDSADYMPPSQLQPLLMRTLGIEWRSLFQTFNETPLAAASIGQVHTGTLIPSLIPLCDLRSPDHPQHVPGEYPVAIKIQYPDIKASIDSDLNNLSLLLTASRLLPKGLYLERTIANARMELAWECDYVREAESLTRFHTLVSLIPDNSFALPHVIPQASGENVLTMTRMLGHPVTRIVDLTQEERNFIGDELLRLTLNEIAKFRFMQTDPNWSNFLWNRQTGKIELLDFGACRSFSDEFVDLYLDLLRAARVRNTVWCRDLSIKLGYLTGMETKAMMDAHVQSIFILAEPFMDPATRGEERYDFRDQTVTERIKALIPVMLQQRLTPPPEETYSLHRKLSGAFLLCAKLGCRVRCRQIFGEIVGFD